MADNKQIAQDVLAAVGGAANVTSATHCMTRLRLNLKDQSVPNDDKVKKIKGVLGAQWSGGQYQVIIGQNVPKVYDELAKLGVTGNGAIDENLDPTLPKEKMTLKRVGNAVLNYLSGSMVPLIPVLMCAGLFRTIQTILGPTFLNLLDDTNNFMVLLNMLFNAGFYFMPIYLGFNAAKQIGVTPILGAFMGGILIEPSFVQMATDGTTFSVYGIPCTPMSYSSTVAPILLTVAVMYPIEKTIKKFMPDVLTTVFTPFITMVITVPVSLCLLAPLGSWLGNGLADLFNTLGSTGSIVSVLACGLLTAIYLPIVVTGMHATLYNLAYASFATIGYDSFILVAFTIGLWAVYGVELGAWLRLRNREEKSQAFGFLVSNVIGGVGEPFIYGMMFRYRRLWPCYCAAGFIAGAVASILHVAVYAPGSSNLLNIITFIGNGPGTLPAAIVSAIVGVVAGAIITWFFGFTKDELENGPVAERV